MFKNKKVGVSLALMIVLALVLGAASMPVADGELFDELSINKHNELDKFAEISFIISLPIQRIQTSPEYYSIEKQTELLHELMDLLNTPDFARGLPIHALRDDNGKPIEAPPVINLIVPPADENGYFMIGLEIDHTGLGFGDWDALKELTGQQPPEVITNFILSFAGIARDLAEIGYAVVLPIPRLPSDYDISDICPVWGDERSIAWNNDTYIENNANSQITRTLRMGQIDYIPGSGVGTIGHPRNSNGRMYVTAVHGHNVLGHAAFTDQNQSIMLGMVSRITFTSNVDIAEVTLFDDTQISTALPGPWNWPGGNSIVNFRGVPGIDDEVRSIGGISGVRQGRIVATNATVGTRTNQLLVYPTNVQNGDSGSALIRVSDSTVMGTASKIALVNHRVHAVYTSIQRY